ncbi:hypothetical protein D3C87_243440 [compost metagenome]
MRKQLLILILSVITNLSLAQQKYYIFNVNGKYGITDTLGNEAIKPTYSHTTSIPAKSQIYFQDFSEKPDIIFNSKTGAKQLYESVYDDKVQIKNVPYSIITNKGKKFLLSEKTDKTIALTRDYNELNAVGQYIIASYYAQDPYVAGGKDKNGKLLPPKIREMKKHYVVLANDESLKTVLNKGFDKYLPLYKIPEEKQDDGLMIVKTVEITLPITNTRANFDYIVLSQGNNHKLYNNKMVLLKAFVLAKADEERLLAFSKKTLKVNINTVPSGDYGMMVSAPMGPSSRRTRNPEPVEKKPFVPFFYVKKLDNGNTIFALQETEEISKRIFEANAKTSVRLYEEECILKISIEGKKDSDFRYNAKSGVLYIPKEYLADLGITLV